nr:recQ-mediated genome instability protein 1 [Pogona vitticeps]XP_020668499.1 recQ-mediated genome instability protein 1 [Pogona vitticeps]
MTPSVLAARVETWLSSTWHVKVSAQWLEACIDWIQQENGGSTLAQASINKQVFEQWLLTDLRDLEYPVLPDCILNDPKGELNGFYSIQIDSLVDVSQPAYSQLQRIRGKNSVNEEITASTQGTLRSWETKPTRMLMLQLTDGIHHIQGMEYHPIPALYSTLPPGTKVMIQGKVGYRLGVLLLKPENVRLLGGEVESLVEEFAAERVLARLIGDEENGPNTIRTNIGESAISQPLDELGQVLGPSDEELLAGLGENDEFSINEVPLESGYYSRSTSSNSARHSSLSNGSSLQQGPAVFISGNEEQNVPILENTEGHFDEFPLDDDLFLEEEVQEEQIQVLNRSPIINCQPTREKKFEERKLYSDTKENTGDFSTNHEVVHIQNLDGCLSYKLVQKNDSKSNEMFSCISSNRLADFHTKIEQYSNHVQSCRIKNKFHEVCLDTPPFTYLSVLLSSKPKCITTVKIKAFIVTLTGNLTSSGGVWSIAAKVSDGTGYLEVNFADEILTSLIGFSVPEMKQLKKVPVLFPKLNEGLQNCQRELIDLCCLMTIEFNPSQTKATVVILQDVNTHDLDNLKRRSHM